MHQTATRYSPGEEIANAVTHGVGIVLSIAGLAVLSGFAASLGDGWHVTACSVFGASLVLCYAASTLYHAIPHPKAKQVLRALDHSAIFLLIAGTYTPVTLVSLRGPWGWSLFGTVWGLAVAGILFRLLLRGRMRWITVLLYVAMGWTVLVAAGPMLENLHPGALWLLLAGGLCYTGGIAFYLWRRLPYHHAVWHCFVLAGSVLHFFAVLFYVIPLRG
jgi:hemolysin III